MTLKPMMCLGLAIFNHLKETTYIILMWANDYMLMLKIAGVCY